MKSKVSRMWRSGVAMLLALCLVAGFLPTVAFAAEAEETINYVSIGDSMTNGYGFAGYYQTSDDRDVYDFMTGEGMYGDGAYPNQFEAYLTGLDYDVRHTKLATSAMLAEDLLYLLGGREYFDDGWGGYKDYIGTYTDAEISDHIKKSVTEADVITMGIGNAAFGAFLMHKLTDALGVFGASLGEDEKVNFEDAIAVLELDAEQYALVMQVYDMLEAKLVEKVPADLAEQYNLEDVVDLMAYTTASYIINYKLLVEQILEMNPDVEIVLVGLLNTTYGMNVTDEDGNVILPFGDVMDSLFDVLNAYMAGLPAVLQAQGVAEEAKLYYAEQPNPQFICQEFENLLNNDWVSDDSRLDGATIRQRNIDAFNSDLAPMIGNAVTGAPLTPITLEDVKAYEALDFAALEAEVKNKNINWTPWAAFYYTGYINDQQTAPDKIMAVCIYLAIEEAVAKSTNTMDIPLSGLVKIAGDLSSVFTALGTPPTNAPEATRLWLLKGLSTEETQGMCKIYGLFKVGNGMSVHPTPAGHDDIAASVIAAYRNHTVKDETIENVKILLNELYNLVETYGPEVAAQVWNQWVEYGYVEAVETTVNKLKDKLNERYTYYTETALPAIEAAVDALAAEKDNLTDELAALKVRLEEKKAELEKVISEQEIGSIHTPNIGIDAELGNNEQTTVSDRECVVDGEGIEAELNAAIKDIEHAIATVEALIADIGADIEDMIALAEQIAAAVAELEKTMADIAAAAEDLANAVQAVVEVLANSDGVIDAVISTFEAGRDTALAAAEVLELTMGVAEDMMGDIDEMIEIIVTDAEALYNKFLTDLPGCIDQIPEEGKMLIGGAILAAQKGLEEGKKLIEAELPGKIAELEAEYADDLAALKAEYEGKITQAEADLEALKAQVQIEIDAKYAEVSEQIKAEYNARIVELEARLEALEAELQGYKTELENLAADAEEAVRQQLQAQIDRVTGDIATVKEDLECALEHLENALQIAYEEIVAEVTAIYEEAMAELQKAADDLKAALEQAAQELKDALDKAVEDLKAAADKAIEDLTAEYEKLVAELEKIGEELSAALNGILESIRDELTAAQQAIEEILKGNLEAVEALADALAALGAEALAELVEDIVDIVEAMLEEATTADLVIDDDFKYVAIGDGSAATESYVEKLAAALNAEAAENGVDGIEVANNAKAGNTVAAERANLSDVSDADLITVGFSNVEFLDKAVVSALNGVAMDWSVIVGEENVRYIDELMAEVADMVAEAGVEGENAVLINTAIEAYAYAAVQYATELPELINDIHAANPEALIIIVGMYNPMKGVTVALNENTTLDIGEYIDYLVQGVAVHGIAYAILTGNAIYVDAPSVDTENVDTELSILELAAMALNKFVALYPSATGDDYVAEEIADALNITYIKSEPAGLLGDANGDGKVLANDAMLVLQYSVSDITADELNLAVCDVNGDGQVLANDAMLILQRSVDPNAKFPIE